MINTFPVVFTALDDVTSTLSIAEKYQDALSFLDKING